MLGQGLVSNLPNVVGERVRFQFDEQGIPGYLNVSGHRRIWSKRRNIIASMKMFLTENAYDL